MDNGAYAKYRAENPVVNTLLSTYDEVTHWPEQLSNAELALVIGLGALAIYALVRVLGKLFHRKPSQTPPSSP
ncbi:MAG: hypothetical protein FGM28_02415 [Limnohabitans sp.]|jgi:hypothetical protein|nr:hypothetical protein [Limnohabitans sp.]